MGSDKWFVSPNLISGIAVSHCLFYSLPTESILKGCVEYINIQSQNIVICACSFTLFIVESVALLDVAIDEQNRSLLKYCYGLALSYKHIKMIFSVATNFASRFTCCCYGH